MVQDHMDQDCPHNQGVGEACLDQDQWQQEGAGGWPGLLALQEIGRDDGVDAD